MLILLSAAVAFEAWTLGPTVDEPSHILSSWLWWHGRDRLYPRDVPPLIKIVGGSAIATLALPVPPDLGKPGDTRQEWVEAANLFGKLPARELQSFLFRARMPFVIFPLLATFVLWHWARERFGAFTALGVATLWAVCPTALGHSALFKNDIAAAATYLLFWYTVSQFWRKPGLLTAGAVGCTASLAILSKLSMLFVPAAAPLLLCARAITLRRFGASLVWPLVSLATVWGITAAAWQFDMHRATAADIAMLAADHDVPRWFSTAVQAVRVVPVPEAAWTGVISLIKADSHPVPVYMLGQLYPEGNQFYFLIATALKMSAPALLLFVIGLLAGPRRLQPADLFWLLPGLLYFWLASLSSLHLGVRLVMPALAFFILTAGAAMERIGRRWTAVALLIAIVLSARVYPYGIAYFNPWAGKPENALQYLADSNIDWGQSLSEVGRYARSHNIEKLHLAYFGFDKAERYFDPGQIVPLAAPWDGKSEVERLVPEKGWYAISATLLPGHLFFPRYRDYFAEFLRRKPEAVAGGSIFIYRID
ncbi:MAG: glycosyltransferase family 39 protein [Bryobacteraceae bacterium]|nr:glycosyltransferase family 39 protein [Bryobacteraceae bacterium]